jgi:hypothetical protein
MRVDLVTLLKDWIDKTKYPTVSIIGCHFSDHFSVWGWQGQIWVGDYDIAIVYDTYIEFNKYSKKHIIHAADPDFFIHLENTIKHYLLVLKNNE